MGEINIQSENKLNVDFSGVEGKKKAVIPEGNYPAKVVEAKAQTSKAGNPMVVWQFMIDGGTHNGQKFYYNTVLLPQSLWNFRNTLEACGVTVEGEGAMDIPLDKLKNRTCGLAIVDGEWDNQKRSEVNDGFSRDLLSETPIDNKPSIEL